MVIHEFCNCNVSGPIIIKKLFINRMQHNNMKTFKSFLEKNDNSELIIILNL